VRASQRSRLLTGMLELVAEQGYARTTIAQIAARARVSPNRFYDFFAGKPECLLEVCRGPGADFIRELLTAEGDDWRTAARDGVARYLAWWAARPQLARAYFVELPTVTEIDLERHVETYERFHTVIAALAARARIEEPAREAASPIAVRVIVAGINDVVREEVGQGRLASLPELEAELGDLLVAFVEAATR
jgi:AcrR family transcriptional regulator